LLWLPPHNNILPLQHMDILVRKLRLRSITQLPRILLAHPQHPRHERKPIRLQPRLKNSLSPKTELLVPLFLWPDSKRPFDLVLDDVGEAGLADEAGEFGGDVEPAVDFEGCRLDVFLVFRK